MTLEKIAAAKLCDAVRSYSYASFDFEPYFTIQP